MPRGSPRAANDDCMAGPDGERTTPASCSRRNTMSRTPISCFTSKHPHAKTADGIANHLGGTLLAPGAGDRGHRPCTGGQARVRGRVLEFYGGGVTWLLHRLPNGQFVLGLTLGHTILGQTDASLDLLWRTRAQNWSTFGNTNAGGSHGSGVPVVLFGSLRLRGRRDIATTPSSGKLTSETTSRG